MVESDYKNEYCIEMDSTFHKYKEEMKEEADDSVL